MTTQSVAISRPAELALGQGEEGFQRFLKQAAQAPMLSADEEYQLATNYRRHNDLEAAHRLVHAHLRLVLKIAREYLYYRSSLPDLVQEGSIGLMHAVKKFDAQRGNRLATYAVWWIRAAIHDFILNTAHMVKVATTKLKRHLFFKLRQAKSSLAPLNQQEAEELAVKFATDAQTILEMDSRLAGADSSLNQPLFDEGGELIELLEDERPNQELQLQSAQQQQRLGRLVKQGLKQLNEREQAIIISRFMGEHAEPREQLAQRFQISGERVRQIEQRAMAKLRSYFQSQPDAQELAMLI
ncbi:RNA polymerase, sigma 32 subunit, RpoH [Magnetococcus marinus MC-1]|uniref:RNA polymerase, sigma 32 subunit, RpoH n=1 Tax=Magnetococcus marinus (strain ATCC BAA-1437 / JCM 17883 / MC-1) TaxID=156889 RepID=A0LC75_MAGMM|nr:RNA polymerase factor sigma-32 [Magnetococcus marinus]ABK45568.1 RNA polymerase, sigma 32 subunit, RpoH [Magnetococcus marinus MC-1]